jgi:hypothetical protein
MQVQNYKDLGGKTNYRRGFNNFWLGFNNPRRGLLKPRAGFISSLPLTDPYYKGSKTASLTLQR